MHRVHGCRGRYVTFGKRELLIAAHALILSQQTGKTMHRKDDLCPRRRAAVIGPFGRYSLTPLLDSLGCMSVSLQLPTQPARFHNLWAHAWRMLLAGVLGFALFGFTYEPFFDVEVGKEPSIIDLRIFLDLVFGVLALGLYPLRHRFPLPIVGTIVLLSTFSVFAAATMAFSLVSVTIRRKPVEIAVVFTLAFVTGMTGELLFPLQEPLPWWQNAIVMVVVLALNLMIGLYLGGRRQLLQSLQEQAMSAQREEQARMQGARAGERTRIAREMHDVLAHRLSLVALHAGALEYRSDLTPAETREAAGVIRQNAHLALGELRDVLGMLRDPNTLFADEHERPQPTLTDLPGLIEQSRAVGTPTEFTIQPGLDAKLALLPEATGRHMYRVIQEALTNARRHAPGEPVSLMLSGKPGKEIRMRASNRLVPNYSEAGAPEALPSSGLGLVGLGERLRLAGGDLILEDAMNGEFHMEAWLPWEK